MAVTDYGVVARLCSRASTMTTNDYVLGTHDEEVARLQLQHRVWRPQVLDAFRRAGSRSGQTLLDIGCGPGDVSQDLAEIAGVSGRVLAIDKSRRFLDLLDLRTRERRLTQLSSLELDLDRDALPDLAIDGAWCRWVMSFMARPRDLVVQVAARLRRGGVLVVHEYFDYATWRTAPPCPEVEEFVRAVMRTWRESGGEPDLGLMLPHWLGELGFDVRDVRPIVEATRPGEPKWDWLAAFVESGRRRMASLGVMSPERAAAISAAVERLAADPTTLMMTPGVLEIVAVRNQRGAARGIWIRRPFCSTMSVFRPRA